ncbi:hypothetical protein MW887_000281 [Aspergillus wentii]|nr:hypothetical protein MW887_000281 [Aspergillus wentii]
MNIAGFGAFDYFGDGSFYLLDTPGHATGHLCGLARTTQDTFIFMGGDIAHHCGEFRPSNHHPIPSKLFPNPLDLSSVLPCPGSLFTSIHPDGRSDTPYYRIGTWPDGSTAADDLQEAEKSLKKLEVYDAKADQVFVILAHDPAMRGVIDFFPSDVNRWREKGWGEKTRWAFLRDFKNAIQFPGRID